VRDPLGHGAVNACLRNGRGQAAEFLAARGGRLDLEGAAGVGRVDIVQSFFDGNGQLKPPATQNQMNYGFAWACEFDRREVVAFLLQNGMDAGSGLTRGETGLHWAAYEGHVQLAAFLLEHVTRVDIKDEAHQGTPLEWALFAWSNADESKHRDYYEIVAMLARAGATLDPKWNQNVARKIQSDPRMLATLRGEVPPP
jgi:ankyrin repeat protein